MLSIGEIAVFQAAQKHYTRNLIALHATELVGDPSSFGEQHALVALDRLVAVGHLRKSPDYGYERTRRGSEVLTESIDDIRNLISGVR